MSQPITPIPAPAGGETGIGGAAGAGAILYGGVFDPPHLGHIQLAAAARDQSAPGAWLVFVPAARSPLKGSPRAGDADRLEMLRLATLGLRRACIWTDEIDRGPPSFWIDTVGRARSILPVGADLRFLIGADQAAQFHRWRDARRILELAGPIVAPRDPLLTPAALGAALAVAGYWTPVEIDAWAGAILDLPALSISATDIRARIGAGARVMPDLDPRVAEYIKTRGLYRIPATAEGSGGEAGAEAAGR